MYNDVHARYRVEISLFLITNPLLHLFHIWNIGNIPQDVYCDLNIQADARPPSNAYGQDGNDTGRTCMFKHLFEYTSCEFLSMLP